MQKKDMMPDQWGKWLKSGAGQLDLDIDQQKIQLLGRFAEELLNAGRVLNLTGITDPREIAVKLMLDSMFPGKFIPDKASVLDLGTGAGFPGIPIKIGFPGLLVTLIDSRRKRINFVKYVIRQLSLEKINARHIRAEDLAMQNSSRFDVVISRAVSSVDQLIKLALPLLKKNGLLMAMKGSGYTTELKNIPFDNIETVTYSLPGLDIKRALLIFSIK